jgi:cyclopropane-fatty-acyl-phospholipid synthase
MDYRDLSGTYDKILTCGMLEHVGYKMHRRFFEIVNRCLADDGLYLLHTIGSNRSEIHCNPWFHKYIFPNGSLPSISQIGRAIEGLFVMEDWHQFSVDYDKTLMAWWHRFDRNWPLLALRFDDSIRRVWKYYLQAMAGGFRARENQLWQILMSKYGVVGGCAPMR